VQVKYKGYKKLAFSTNISHYFENGTRYSHNYNGRRVGGIKNWRFRPIFRIISKTVQDTAIITMEDE